VETTFLTVIDREESSQSLVATVVVSIIIHIVIFIIVPLFIAILWRPKKFERPKTFEIVAVKITPKAKPQPKKVEPKKVEKVPPKEVIKEKPKMPVKKEVVKKKVTKKTSKPTPEPKVTENFDDLDELLEAVAPPQSAIKMGTPFPYQWYINNIRSKVQKNWAPAIQDSTVSIILQFEISADGSIGAVSVVGRSGKTGLDAQAKRAIEQSAPFGKLPPAFREKSLKLTYTLIPFKQ
jgi:TonB family protein